MRIGRFILARCALVAAASAMALLASVSACNPLQALQQGPAAGLTLDSSSIILILKNESGTFVRADAVFRQGVFEVRRTVRILANDGQTASSEVLPTRADTLTIEASEFASDTQPAPGDPNPCAPVVQNPPSGSTGLSIPSQRSATLVIGQDFQAGDTVTFIIRKDVIIPIVNHGPMALTIPEITVPSGGVAILDASRSADPDSCDTLTFKWEQLSGPLVSLDNAGIARPQFTAPIVPPNQTVSLSFRVIVSDPGGETSESLVKVLVVGPLPIGIAISGPHDIAARATASISSQISGGVTPYARQWIVASSPSGDPGVFGSPTEADTTWKPPGSELGTWVLQLRVTDKQGNPASADFSVSVQLDCNTNAAIDSQEIVAGAVSDCDGNGVPDVCDVAGGRTRDCNTNGVPDSCEFGRSHDCNTNGILDVCDSAAGPTTDCNTDGVPDACQLATLRDCNVNGVPDACDIATGAARDCNANGIPDACDIASGTAKDCNANGVPDACDLAGGAARDCNANGVPDACDIASGAAKDCNTDGVPDTCQLPTLTDCNANGVPDVCDIAGGMAQDCNTDQIVDSCQLGSTPDCNTNGAPDVCDLASGTAHDCNTNGVLDVCDLRSGAARDCNTNGLLDVCELSAATDCNTSQILDVCELAVGILHDCDSNGMIDECDPNGPPDCPVIYCDPANGDCNGNQIWDACDILLGTSDDCNQNGIPDECDIASGHSRDLNEDGVPDECDGGGGKGGGGR